MGCRFLSSGFNFNMEREMRNAALIGVGVIAAMAGTAWSQCTPSWDRSLGNPGATDPLGGSIGYVGAMTMYQGDLVVSGSFKGMANVPDTKYIARWDFDTSTWSPFLTGLGDAPSNSFGTSFAQMGGDLYVGGFFADAAGVPDTKSIARWDGTQFHSLGTGWGFNTVNAVWSMTASNFTGQDRVYFGGYFNPFNETDSRSVAMWDGTSVTPIVNSMPYLIQPNTNPVQSINPAVFSMLVHDDGMGGGPQLYISGRFNNIDGQTILNVGRWNGTTWSAVGTGLGHTVVSAEGTTMYVWNNELYVGGSNLRLNGVLQQVVKWNGTTWSAVGQNPGGRVWKLAAFNDGSGEKLYAAGTAAGTLLRIFRLEGNTWVSVDGGADAQAVTMLVNDGKLHIGGSFSNVGGAPSTRIVTRTSCPPCGSQDYNGDGDFGTDADIEAFFACLGGSCCATCWYLGSDFNGDGDFGTDQDIEAFFRVLGGGSC
jgi:hypothetical protein